MFTSMKRNGARGLASYNCVSELGVTAPLILGGGSPLLSCGVLQAERRGKRSSGHVKFRQDKCILAFTVFHPGLNLFVKLTN